MKYKETTGATNIVNTIKAGRLRWTGHPQRFLRQNQGKLDEEVDQDRAGRKESMKMQKAKAKGSRGPPRTVELKMMNDEFISCHKD